MTTELESLHSALGEAERYTKELEARLAEREWRPIETAPMGESGKPETYFLGCRSEGKRLSVATCYRNQHGAYEWWGGGLTPTHWQPLPPPPSI